MTFGRIKIIIEKSSSTYKHISIALDICNFIIYCKASDLKDGTQFLNTVLKKLTLLDPEKNARTM